MFDKKFFYRMVEAAVNDIIFLNNFVATVCGNTAYYGPSGEINSPNYPDFYPNNLDCDYNIYASPGSSITIIFKWFHTEENVDFVTVSICRFQFYF